LILSAAKAENQKENKRQQKQTNSKTDTISEALCNIDAEDDPDDEIYKRNEHQEYPPAWPACDLAQKIGVHDRNDGCPAFVKTFQSAAIIKTTNPNQQIQKTGPGALPCDEYE